MPDLRPACALTVDSTRHTCECVCIHCEANGTGYFAFRRALDGDKRARQGLSFAIRRALDVVAVSGPLVLRRRRARNARR